MTRSARTSRTGKVMHFCSHAAGHRRPGCVAHVNVRRSALLSSFCQVQLFCVTNQLACVSHSSASDHVVTFACVGGCLAPRRLYSAVGWIFGGDSGGQAGDRINWMIAKYGCISDLGCVGSSVSRSHDVRLRLDACWFPGRPMVAATWCANLSDRST